MLTQEDYKHAAEHIGCGIAVIKAVAHQESNGSGFYASGRIKIKFEGHVFHHLTGGVFAKEDPTLSYPAWTERYSGYGEDAYIRFNAAFYLDKKAAMMATSWGMFQIMGENYDSCGFKSVDEFVSAQHIGEHVQLDSFSQYVINRGLAHFLINLPASPLENAAGFALRYNGTGYKNNHYDINIVKDFINFSHAA